VPVLAAVAIGIVIDRYAEPYQTSTWVGLALASGTIATLTIRRSVIFSLAILSAFGAIGAGWHHYRWSDQAKDDLAWSITETPQPAWIRAVVRESLGLRRSDGPASRAGEAEKVTSRFVLDLTAINDGDRWRTASGRAMVIVTGDCRQIHPGQTVQAAGHLARLAPALNPGEFDYRSFLRAQGIRLRFTVDDPESLWPDDRGAISVFSRLLGRIQSGCRAQVFDHFDPTIAPLAAALLLGQREGIEPEVNDAFARTGTTHLLAISGLQLQALACALLILFRVIGFGRRPAYLVVGLAMVGYALLVGLAPSVVRSTVMTVTFCLAAIGHRLDRPANTMALAALATLAINPVFLFDIGCQLSFLAIGSLIWLVPAACDLAWCGYETLRRTLFGPRSPLDDLERRFEPRWRTVARRARIGLVNAAVASSVVWLAALPLVALRFHLVSPIGILLNLPLIPLTSTALLLGGLGLALGAVWGPLGGPLTWAAGCLLKLTQTIALWGVAQPWGHRFVVGPAWGWVIIFYALFCLAAVGSLVTARHSTTLPARLLFTSGLWFLLAAWVVHGWLLSHIARRSSTLEAEFLAVGHGLAALIQTPDGRSMLYDCGRLGDPNVGRRLIAPALWARGVTRIDTIFLSHADQDHYDGLPDLLDRFPIGAVLVPPRFATAANPAAKTLIDQIALRGIPVQTIKAPDCWERAGVRFTVLHPPADWHPETSDNARSLVLDIASEGRHLLLTGDLEQLGLRELVAKSPPRMPPDVLLAPHHGGRAANPEILYEWAKPRIVVVSQRPSAVRTPDALSFLERRGIPLLRTWRTGAIRLRWTTAGITAHGFLEEPNRPPSWSAPTASTVRVLVGLLAFALGGIACLILAVIEFGAWALVLPPRSMKDWEDSAENLAAGESQRFIEKLVVEASDGVRLAARWCPAHGSATTGRTVLLLHGFAEVSTVLEMRRATALNRHGWNVASLDSRGYGASEGPHSTFGGREARDIRVWLDALAKRVARTAPEQPFQPALWGRSMGAAIALRAAALDRRPIALILESPLVDIDATAAVILRKRRLPFPKLLARLMIRRAGTLVGMPLHSPRPVESAARVECPALIIHGTDDALVPIAQARALADAFPSPPRWFDVPGATHTDVIDLGGDDLLDRIAAFLEQASGGAEQSCSQTPAEL
jgi:competence protein ComEC